eukprot:3774563-Alexandrium_andersonii.AAC.1
MEGGAEGSTSAREAVPPAEASPDPETEEAVSDAGAVGAAPPPEPGVANLGSVIWEDSTWASEAGDPEAGQPSVVAAAAPPPEAAMDRPPSASGGGELLGGGAGGACGGRLPCGGLGPEAACPSAARSGQS